MQLRVCMMIAVFVPKEPVWKYYDKPADLTHQFIDPACAECGVVHAFML